MDHFIQPNMRFLAIILGVIVSAAGSYGKCPAYFEEYNMACYYLASYAVASVNEAAVACLGLGGYLLNIDAELEYSHVVDSIREQTKQFDGYWTGAVYKNGNWVWERRDVGVTVDTFMDPDAAYYHWAPNEPSSSFPRWFAAIMTRGRGQGQGRGRPFQLYSVRGDLTTPRGMAYICEAEWIE